MGRDSDERREREERDRRDREERERRDRDERERRDREERERRDREERERREREERERRNGRRSGNGGGGDCQCDMGLAYKILCIVSGVLGLIVLFLSCVFLATFAHSHGDDGYYRGDTYTNNNGYDERHEGHGLEITAAVVGILASFCQVVFACLLLLKCMGDKKTYLIAHIIFAICFVLAMVLAIINGYGCHVCQAFYAFLIVDAIFCVVSALVLCLVK